MALRNIFLLVVVTMVCHSHCNTESAEEALLNLLLKALKPEVESKADKPRKDEVRLQCEIFCEECFPDSFTIKRMGCFEKCIAKGVDNFSCPGEQTFLGEVPPISPVLEKEIQQFFKERSDIFTAQDIDAIINTFTIDSVLITDKQMPVIGRDDRRNKLIDLFDANPHLGRMEFTVDVCGEEYGIIWCNGVHVGYNKQGELMDALDFMSLLTHVDGKLQEYTMVLFPESKTLAEDVFNNKK